MRYQKARMREIKMKRLEYAVLIILCCCSSCTPIFHNDVVTNDETSTVASLVYASQSSVTKPQSTINRSPSGTPSPQIIPISTPTMTVYPQKNSSQTIIIEEKIDIDAVFSKNSLKSDLIVLEGMSILDLSNQISFPMQNPSYFWDFSTGQKQELTIAENQEIRSFAISPDNLLLAYWVSTYPRGPNILRIVDNSGKLVSETTHSNRTWFTLIGWYNEQHVMFDKMIFTEDHYRILPWPVVVYDPFTENIVMELSVSPRAGVQSVPAYPWDRNTYTSAVYSPDFQYVVIVNNVYNLVLWDIRNNSAINEFTTNTYEFGPPTWSAGGLFFVTDRRVDPELSEGKEQEELFQIDLQGKEEQLTYFSDYFAESRIAGFSLSPDERYIAFNLSTEKTDPDYKIALFDKENREIRIYSNLISYHFSAYVPYLSPVWSPDSNQIMAAVNKEGSEGYRTVLIDLEENYAVELAEDVKPVGWMLSGE
jgi:hypothetical protein